MGKFDAVGGFSAEVMGMAEEALASCHCQQEGYESIRRVNMRRVLMAFRKAGLSDYQFGGTTGYGYNDSGREAIEEAFAMIAGAESSLVRHQIVSGTHAIALALFGVLRPGGRLLAAFGRPYDTLDGIIHGKDGYGSLGEFGVSYSEVAPGAAGGPDLAGI
ncbi:MAG TPA: methionine gamma-lyase family protein, partial [Bacillota bacterium]|nr:methionine gamma-lyase family protein [Bacillota bacterium]